VRSGDLRGKSVAGSVSEDLISTSLQWGDYSHRRRPSAVSTAS